MKFTVLTIFPELVAAMRAHGILRRAVQRGQIDICAIDIREFAAGRHRVTDDRPYGGGCGMVMKPEPLAAAIRFARGRMPGASVVHLTPQGRPFCQAAAWDLALRGGLILVCGRYEGIDERVCSDFIDEEISIGDYVLTGGELPALVVIDAVARLIPGVLGGESSAVKDSFHESLLEHGHYTRPRVFEGHAVPDVLLSGNHREIEKWRREASLVRTFLKRPDLLMHRALSPAEVEILQKWRSDIEKIIRNQSLHSADSLSGDQQAG